MPGNLVEVGKKRMPRIINTVLIGLGNVNRNFLQLLETKGDSIATQYGLAFRIVGTADSSGVAANPAGFDPVQLRHFKEKGGRVQQLAEFLPNRTPPIYSTIWRVIWFSKHHRLI